MDKCDPSLQPEYVTFIEKFRFQRYSTNNFAKNGYFYKKWLI